MTHDAAWRPIIAALANDDARPVAGALLAGHDAGAALAALPAAKRARVVRTLVDAGLAEQRGDDLVARPEVFRELLRSAPIERPTGIARFVRDGRIERWPSSADDRAELLAWAAERVLAAGEVADEATVTERLAGIFGDPVALRRSLVDAGMLERSRDGAEYSRPA